MIFSPKPLLLVLLGSMISSIVFAQTVSVSGTVQDAINNDPVVGATVSFPDFSKGAFTDENGRYQVELSVTGRSEINMIVSFNGYVKQTLSISIDGQNAISQDVLLDPEGYTAEDVVITATKGFEQKQSDVTVSIQVVKPRSIDLQATPNIGKVITQIPGVDDQDGQINIRGSSGFAYGVGSRVMVALDGLPLLTGDAGSAALDLIPVDNIAQVEVMKGASSVLYGSGALGGVINVISADAGPDPVTSVRVRGSLYGTPRNEAIDWDGDKNAYAGSAHIFHKRKIGDVDLALQTDFIKDSGYRMGTDTEQFRGVLISKFRPKNIPGLTIGLNASTRIDSSGQILYWRSYDPDTLKSITGRDSVVGGALTPTLDNGGFRRQLSTQFAIDPMFKYLTGNGNLFWYRGRFLRNGTQNDTDQSNQNFIFYNDFLFQTTLANKINWVTGLTYTYAVANGDSLYGGRHPGSSLGVYTQLDGKFGPLTASLGLRFETVKIDTLERESQPIARLGLNYKIAEGTNVRASFGQAFRVPTVAERYANTAGGGILVEPNPLVKSERGYSAELGIRQGYRTNGTGLKLTGYMDVAAFVMDYNDMVEFGISNVGLGQGGGLEVKFSSVNIARARIRGMEITTLNTAEWGKWYANLSGGITLTDPKNLNAVSEDAQLNLSEYGPISELSGFELLTLLNEISDPSLSDAPETLKYRARRLIRVSASLGYDKIGLTMNFRDRSFIETIDQYLFLVVDGLKGFRDRYPEGNKVFDFILNYDLSPKSTVSVNVDNAFNREYLIIPGYLGAQRKFTLQYLIRF